MLEIFPTYLAILFEFWCNHFALRIQSKLDSWNRMHGISHLPLKKIRQKQIYKLKCVLVFDTYTFGNTRATNKIFTTAYEWWIKGHSALIITINIKLHYTLLWQKLLKLLQKLLQTFTKTSLLWQKHSIAMEKLSIMRRSRSYSSIETYHMKDMRRESSEKVMK